MKKIINKIFFVFKNIVEGLENKKVGLVPWFITLFSFILFRSFLEDISVKYNYVSQANFVFIFFHAPLFYLLTFLLFILLTYFLTREKIEKISKASLGLLPLILLAPLIDLLVFQGRSAKMFYIQPVFEKTSGSFDMIIYFFKYILFGPMGLLNFGEAIPFFHKYSASFDLNYTANYGIRIQLILIVMVFVFYIFLKTKSIWKIFLALLFSQAILFFVGYTPYVIENFSRLFNTGSAFYDVPKLNSIFNWDYIISSFLVIFIFLSSLLWFYFYNKRKFFSFIKNLRLLRLGMYLGAFWYGVYLAKLPSDLSYADWLVLIMANLAIVFSWMFAVGSNDIADEKADIVSNPNRPLVSGIINKEEIRSINIVLRVVSYGISFLAGYVFFTTILLRSSISYLYSNEPFRLKKFPFISTFCIATAVFLGVIGGYLILSTNSIYNFPVKLAVLILIVFTLSMNVIHIKDYKGDKEDGVMTIPVIFGLAKGKIIVGILSAFSFLVPSLIYLDKFNILFIPSLVCAVLAFFLINRENFKEWPVLLLYYAYTLPVMFYIY